MDTFYIIIGCFVGIVFTVLMFVVLNPGGKSVFSVENKSDFDQELFDFLSEVIEKGEIEYGVFGTDLQIFGISDLCVRYKETKVRISWHDDHDFCGLEVNNVSYAHSKSVASALVKVALIRASGLINEDRERILKSNALHSS